LAESREAGLDTVPLAGDLSGMKKSRSWLLVLTVSLVVFSAISMGSAQARERAKSKAEILQTTDATANLSPYRQDRKGLGFASVQGLTGTATSVTGWLELDSINSVQAFFGIPTTSPFQFSLGGLYRHTVASKGSASFHVGGGFAAGILGTGRKTDFSLSLVANAGIRYQLQDSPVFVSLDGGPGFSLLNGTSNFSIGALSGLLGASVIYVF
jgi:hypothetical protein